MSEQLVAMAGRPCNVTLHCNACNTTLTVFGHWDGERIAAWSDQHTIPILAGWDVIDGTGYVSHVETNIPAAVRVVRRR